MLKQDKGVVSFKQQAKEFVVLKFKTIKERDMAISKLPYMVQNEVREMIEKERGIRHVNGKIEFSTKELQSQISRLEDKKASYKDREVALDERIAELKEELTTR